MESPFDINKKKSVKDLIRFISNRTDNSIPNFSLLLGAGASVTSGVRSGQTLISDWKKEILLEEEIELGSNEDYFNNGNFPEWYDASNPYSCLFEKRYDLQRQRRIFVEKEVSGKTPSIGYAYLVKLIENNYFNTVFTTNFDDLLNEAFNRFSLLHPIVCAHDSSISGVSVTSKSPKIIKLHGDYLFDNLRATINETKKLDENMNKKFQEFAKDFGLIVIGYGGQDESIMNILEVLTGNDDSFKNGIYWCIRKGESDFSDKLKSLLNNKKVFYVEIEGFDEFMAELNKSLNSGKLPIDDEFLGYERQKKVVRDLTENNAIRTSTSNILKEDCERLKTRVADSMMNDFVTFVKSKREQEDGKKIIRKPERKTVLKPLSLEQKNIIDEINSLAFIFHNTDKALQLLSQYDMLSMDDSLFKQELLEMFADLSKSFSDEDIKKYFDELIHLNPYNQSYYMIAANRSIGFEQKKHYFELAKLKFNHDYYVYNKYSEFIIDYCSERVDFKLLEDEIHSAEKSINISLELNPHISNEARILKAKLIKMIYANKRDMLKEELKHLSDETFNLDSYSITTYSVLEECHDDRFNEKNLRNAIEFYYTSDELDSLENLYIKLCNNIAYKGSFTEVIDICNEYEKDFKPSYNYIFWKANKFVENEKFDEANELVRGIKETYSIIRLKMRILSYQERYDELREYYEKQLDMNWDTKTHNDLKKFYFEMSHNYKEICELFKEQFSNDESLISKDDLADYSYALLQINEDERCMNLLRPYYDNPETRTATIIVNYLLAKKRKGFNISKKINEIIENKFYNFSDFEKIGLYALAGQKNDMYSLIKKELAREPSLKYSIRYWPVMIEYKNESKYQLLLK